MALQKKAKMTLILKDFLEIKTTGNENQ